MEAQSEVPGGAGGLRGAERLAAHDPDRTLARGYALVEEGRDLVEFCAGELEAVSHGLEELRLDDLVARLEGARQP